MTSHKFLASTALREFWDITRPIVFLGEWCKPYHLKHFWGSLDSETLNIEINHTQKEFNYTLKVYESLLPIIATWLNKIQRTSYSLKYWKIIIGPFLLWYIQVLYNRYSYLKTAYSIYPDIDTTGLSDQCYFTPINTNEFYMLATESDAWNLQIITQLLQLMSVKSIHYKHYSWSAEKKQREKLFNRNTSYKLITKIKMNMLRIVLKLRKSRSIGVYFCGISQKNMYKILVSSGFRIFPVVQFENNNDKLKENKLNLALRKQLSHLNCEDKFGKMVLETLPYNMPLNFIECYKDASKQSEKSFPYHFNTIVAAGWNPDDTLKFWGAKKAEQGVKIVDIQHGGGYGTHQYSTREWLERDNCDAFISWGWSGEKVIPAASIIACEKRLNKKTNNQVILWVVNEIPRYLLSLEKSLHSLEHSYRKTQSRFSEKLKPQVRQKITMRIRPKSKHIEEIKSIMPEINIYMSGDKHCFFEQLSTAKIFISDNLQTTFLYALSYNIPTILFSDNELKHLNFEAFVYFEKLLQCGIYHDSPESAANKLNQIYNDPDAWWHDAAVQKVRQEFCDKFSRTTPNWLSEWNQLLLNLDNSE